MLGLGSNHGLLGETHLGRVGGLRLPLGRGTRSGLLHHPVDLLQGETLGFGNQEVSVDAGAGTERAPDEEHLGAEVTLVRVNHVGGDDGDDLKKGVVLAGMFSFFFADKAELGYLRSSRASWKRWKEQHRGNGSEEDRSLR